MSRFEGWITTNTQRRLDEVYSWLDDLPNWRGTGIAGEDSSHIRVAESIDGALVARVIDSGNHRPGSAASSIERLGAPRTIMFDMYMIRDRSIGQLDQMYGVAFEFCKWDSNCNVLFSLDDDNRGVFLRRNGLYLVNPDEFASRSLSEFLTFPYQIADSPTNLLVKKGWPPEQNRSAEG